MSPDILIVGAGLAGLCCANVLQQRGISFELLEASDSVGGRIRTDVVDGFRLDRGFQVFLDSYPEAKTVLNIEDLNLRPFLPGALVRYSGRFYELTDPWRRPLAAVGSLTSPIGSIVDKLRVAKLRTGSLQGSIEDRFRDPETTTYDALHQAGFSAAMIERFFRPFLGGIFLDRQLQTSSRMLNFVFRMFSIGNACLPEEGMEAIPRQLAAQIPPGKIRLGSRVERVDAGRVRLSTGEDISAKAVVIAVDGPSAARLLGSSIHSAGKSTTCLYFSASLAPLARPLLVLNGDGRGPINSLCCPTSVAPSYGPGDQSLVSVSVLERFENADRLMADVRRQLGDWFGPQTQQWRHLRTYWIPYALPNQQPPALREPQRPVRWSTGIYVCGDHRDNASIQGAMVSGRRAAEAILQDFQ